MKKISLFLVICFILNIRLTSQTFQWVNDHIGNATHYHHGNAVCTDTSGSVYNVGTFTGNITVVGSPSLSASSSSVGSAFLCKRNAAGVTQWGRAFSGSVVGTGNAVTCDPWGNVYFVGDYSGSINYWNGSSITISSTSRHLYVAKVNSQGAFLWIKGLNSSLYNGTSEGFAVMCDAVGGVYIGGCFTGTVDFNPATGVNTKASAGSSDGFILKLDTAGTYQWCYKTGNYTGQDCVMSLSQPNSGGYLYYAGYYNTSGTFKALSGSVDKSNGSSGQGNFILSTNWSQALSIVCDTSGSFFTGSYYVVGFFTGTADFNPSGLGYSLTAVGGRDIFIAKYNALSHLVWAKSMGSTQSDEGKGIGMDSQGNIWITGYFEYLTDFDPGPGTATLTTYTLSGTPDVFLAKYDPNGNYQWVGKMGGVQDDRGRGIFIDDLDNIYSTGTYMNIPDFDPGPATYTAMYGNQYYTEAYVHKMASCSAAPSLTGSISGTTQLCPGASAIYSFGPVGGATSYNWLLPSGWIGSSTTRSIQVSPSASGSMSLTVANFCGVSAPLIYSITVSQLPAIGVTANPSTVCPGQSVTLTATGGISYSWSPGNQSGNSYVITPAQPLSYTVTGSNSTGCKNSAQVHINLFPTVSVSVSGPDTICNGQTINLLASGAQNYTWSSGENGAGISVSPVQSTVYTVSGTDINGCSSQAQLHIEVLDCGVVGLEKGQAKAPVLLYPNPNKGVLFLENCSENTTPLLYNSLGQLVQLKNKESACNSRKELDLTLLPRGVYFIRIEDQVWKVLKD